MRSDETFEKSREIFQQLFSDSWSSNPLQMIFALVRVGGMSDPNWDPMLESLAAFEDYEVLLEEIDATSSKQRHYRLRLLYYCHLVEASAPYNLVMNLLRCRAGMDYHISPFHYLYRQKGKSLVRVPPSVAAKMRAIREFEAKHSDGRVISQLEKAVDESIRNSFFHSDYCFSDSEYRSLGSPTKVFEFSDLDRFLDEAFAIYGALLAIWSSARQQLGSQKKVHKLPNFETLELLSDDDRLLSGFKVHFSNGSVATYNRTPAGTIAENLTFGGDGDVGFMVGDIGRMKRGWYWNGNPVDDWSQLP